MDRAWSENVAGSPALLQSAAVRIPGPMRRPIGGRVIALAVSWLPGCARTIQLKQRGAVITLSASVYLRGND
jgi:hypothetical protein